MTLFSGDVEAGTGGGGGDFNEGERSSCSVEEYVAFQEDGGS